MRLAPIALTALALTLAACEGGGDPVEQAPRDAASKNHAARVQEGVVSAPAHAGGHGTPDAATLEAWRDAGAPAVLVTGSAAELRAAVQAAEAVPAPHRSEDRGTPLIGALRAANEHHHDDDDGDDDF